MNFLMFTGLPQLRNYLAWISDAMEVSFSIYFYFQPSRSYLFAQLPWTMSKFKTENFPLFRSLPQV